MDFGFVFLPGFVGQTKRAVLVFCQNEGIFIQINDKITHVWIMLQLQLH